MNREVREYARSHEMIRPELHEMKSTIKQLKKDAEMRLTLDVEAQQSFEFLSDQVDSPAMRLPWPPYAGPRLPAAHCW